MFSLTCDWTNGWVNNRDAGDLRHHGAHYDVTVINAWPMSMDDFYHSLLFFLLSVGALHDGNSQVGCTGRDQFIMASSPGVLTDLNYQNALTFSPCSIRSFREHLGLLTMWVFIEVFFLIPPCTVPPVLSQSLKAPVVHFARIREITLIVSSLTCQGRLRRTTDSLYCLEATLICNDGVPIVVSQRDVHTCPGHC